MKIKILKDIPGFKAGEELGSEVVIEGKYLVCIPGYAMNGSREKHDIIKYPIDQLQTWGFIQEIKYDVDIEAIRQKVSIEVGIFESKTNDYLPESKWFKSYLTVKEVITQLNGDWKPIYEVGMDHYQILGYNYDEKKLIHDQDYYRLFTLLPPCRDVNVAEKVIELCEPELKVLFKVN